MFRDLPSYAGAAFGMGGQPILLFLLKPVDLEVGGGFTEVMEQPG
jgi:hypothetical protein